MHFSWILLSACVSKEVWWQRDSSELRQQFLQGWLAHNYVSGRLCVECFSAWYVEPSDCCRWGLCTSQRLSSIGFRCRGILLARLGYALTRNRIIPSACGREGWWCYSGSSSGQLLCFSTVHEMSVRNSTSRTGGQIKSAPASNRRKNGQQHED